MSKQRCIHPFCPTPPSFPFYHTSILHIREYYDGLGKSWGFLNLPRLSGDQAITLHQPDAAGCEIMNQFLTAHSSLSTTGRTILMQIADDLIHVEPFGSVAIRQRTWSAHLRTSFHTMSVWKSAAVVLSLHLVQRPSCLFKKRLTAALTRHATVDIVSDNPQMTADARPALATVISQMFLDLPASSVLVDRLLTVFVTVG